VLANRDAQDAFKAYLTNANDKQDYSGMPGFPEGTQAFGYISVTRK
jgi:hypothetical protein